MDSQKQQVVERLKQANNILVTVRSNPSVDQLAACIGVTLALNKMGKHATAVFSGAIPSTIEFLQPEKTLEKNTDSLQDFIIALDKSKADKLRYKVEDTMVKIFITPYRTSINEKDLQFSQGDFNVDVVLALGVHAQGDLDQAITSHGRILHDATVMCVNTQSGPSLGNINWLDASVSSLSEMGVQLIDALDHQLMDGQIATSFLTGIVAETERFSNAKTSPQTMSISAELMSAGANQQLVATKLEEPAPLPPAPKPIEEAKSKEQFEPKPIEAPEPPKPRDDGTIEISHENEKPSMPELNLPPVPSAPTFEEPEEQEGPKAPQIHIDEHGQLQPMRNEVPKPEPTPVLTPAPSEPKSADVLPPEAPLPPIVKEEGPRLMTEPPTFETPPLTANAEPEREDSPTDGMSLPNVGLLNREPLPSQQPLSPTSSFNTPPSLSPPTGPVREATPPSPVSLPGQEDKTGINAPEPTGQPLVSQPPMTPWSPPPEITRNASRTLAEIEKDVHSPHANMPENNAAPADLTPNVIKPQQEEVPNVADARDAVANAISANPDSQRLEPITELNAMPLGEVHSENPADQQAQVSVQPPATPPVFQPNMGQTPPASPPPMMPPNFPPA